MAELLTANGWTQPDSLGDYLRHALPDDYFVVADPVIRGRPVAAVVVGRSGLLLLHDPNDTLPARQAARAALEAFLADEFPGLRPPIRQLKATVAPEGGPTGWIAIEDVATHGDSLAGAIEALDGPPPATAWRDAKEQEALAVALRDRRLTITQRATRPFVFRSGSALRTGARAWTVQDAVRHMDRHPEDGMLYLRDGTLAAWLEEEGAPHLAQLAREVINRPRIEPRAALENFLIGTGLVRRPTLRLFPRRVDLGYVIQGGRPARVLRLRRGRGRGYLFGALRPAEPWLEVAPDSFQGGPAEVVVAAATAGLAIQAQPHAGELRLTTSASEAPVAVPVSVRVTALPGRANRALLRPLAGLLIAAVPGAAIGALGPLAGVAAPRWLADLGLPGGPWALPIGLLWALAGLIRAANQPPAWPIAYAGLRWLARALAWAAGLAVLAAAVVVAWREGLGGGLALPWLTPLAAAVVAAGLGCLPATLDELAAASHQAIPGYVHGRRSRRRTALLGAAAVILLLLALLTPRLVAPVAGRLETGALLAPVQTWATERWEALNRAADDLLERAILRYYDRAAPTATPTAAPRATPTP